MTKAIWGWGGLKLVYSTKNVEFTTAFVRLEFEPELVSAKLTNGNLYQKLKGWRAYLSCEIMNYDDGDSAKIVTLISMLNDSLAANGSLTIYPKYETPDTGQNWNGTFRLDSRIGFDDIAKNVFAGQSTKLDFIGSALISTLPDNTSDTDQVLRKHGVAIDTYRVYDSTDSTSYRKAEG
jgi:hypothetical protein